MLAHCIVSVSPIRIEPNLHSEMISQILFGEFCEILDQKDNFFLVKMEKDEVQGWVSALQLSEINSRFSTSVITTPLESYFNHQGRYFLSLGSEIPSSDEVGKVQEPSGLGVEKVAQSLLSIPYLQGGRSCFGTDADGFVQLCFKAVGISLPRWVKDQATQGEVLDFLGESEAGDLAFFEDESGQIIHVGIMLNNYQVIHSYGKVRVDSLDSSGIFNVDLKKHTHKLRFVKRILNSK